MAQTTRKVSVTMPEELADEADRRAFEADISTSELYRRSVQEYLDSVKGGALSYEAIAQR